MLARRTIPGRVSLVPLIDVLFILLVYFMVTSVYRDLDMIPMTQGIDAAAPAADAAPGRASPPVLLIRIDGTGRVIVRGRTLPASDLIEFLSPLAKTSRVMILPSGAAPLWALTSVMDGLTGAGVADVRLIRLEARE